MSKANNNEQTTHSPTAPKVAIVHDWLYGGGAEQVVLELHRMFPEAPIYTSFATDEWREKLNHKVVTGYLQWWPFRHLRKFLPLLRQWWFSGLDLSSYDLVISSSGNGEAKFVKTPPGTKHFCYCHTPTHFYWRHFDQYLKRPGVRPYWLVRLGLRLLVKPLRRRDYQAAQRVDVFIANSSHIQSDIKRYYDRDSTVIHPPVDTTRFKTAPDTTVRNSFITVGRQTPFKRTDIIVEACNKLAVNLVVVGSGPEHENLKQLAGPTVTFRGALYGEELVQLVASAKAFLFAAHEDFGIAPVEALAAGTPVIAYHAGGALDYVVEGKTGMFFAEQTAESLAHVLRKFENTTWDHDDISRHAEQFSTQAFHNSIKKLIIKHSDSY